MSETRTIHSLATETAELVRTHQEGVTAARHFHDPDLTPDAIRRKRGEQEAELRSKSSATLAEVRNRLESALEANAKRAAALRPRIQEEPVTLIQAEHIWKYDVMPVLEAGETLKNFLRTASADEVLAVERFGRGYLAAVARRGGNPLEFDPDELQAGVNNRLMLTAPEAQRQDFEDSIRAQSAGQRLQKAQELASQYFNGQDGLYQGAYGQSASAAAQLGE